MGVLQEVGELFDRPGVSFRLKTHLLQAQAVEASLYGCMTWPPRRDHYRLLQTTHHRLLLRVIQYRRKRGTYRQLRYAQALKRIVGQSVGATVRQRHPPAIHGGERVMYALPYLWPHQSAKRITLSSPD